MDEKTIIEQKKIPFEEIKEIRLHWDFESVIFPREKIKNFSYVLNENHVSYSKPFESWGKQFAVSLVSLEVDLEYAKKSYVYYGEKEDKTKMAFPLLKSCTTWNLEIITNKEEAIGVIVPSFYKDLEMEKGGVNVWNAKNYFENVLETKDSFVLKWEVDTNKLQVTFEELESLFKTNRIGASKTGLLIQVELLNRLLKEKNEEERRLVMGRISELNRSNHYQFRYLKRGYKCNISSEENKITCHIKNKSYSGNIYYLFVRENKIEKQKLLQDKLDTSHYFSRIILAFDKNINIEKTTNQFRNQWNEEEKKYFSEKLLWIDYEQLVQIWIELYKKWYIDDLQW